METLDPVPLTPFGRRPLSAAMIAAHNGVKACAEGKAAHKWQVFKSICESKIRLGISERALTVLNALLTFHPDTVLTSGSADLVVFPSNQALSLRAHGMPASTLRRHLAVLLESGLILRRDSPNGKRYARKDLGGEVAQAFGFDLGPIIARAEEFAQLATGVRAEREALCILRARITFCRRDITKMMAFGLDQGVAADWLGMAAHLRDLLRQMPRRPVLGGLERIAEQLEVFAAEVLMILEQNAKSKESGATESQSGRLIQNSNTEIVFESEAGLAEKVSPPPSALSLSQAMPEIIPLSTVLEACPDIIDYARGRISNWRDFMAAATLVRSFLGISPSAWKETCETMGESRASIVVAAILQRGADIKSPGGYLRTLARRASRGEFSVWPMLMALTASRQKREAMTVEGSSNFW